MHSNGISREQQDVLIAALIDALGYALDSTVMAIVGVDENDVFVLPMPGHAAEVFGYLGKVAWATKAKEARLADQLPNN